MRAATLCLLTIALTWSVPGHLAAAEGNQLTQVAQPKQRATGADTYARGFNKCASAPYLFGKARDFCFAAIGARFKQVKAFLSGDRETAKVQGVIAGTGRRLAWLSFKKAFSNKILGPWYKLRGRVGMAQEKIARVAQSQLAALGLGIPLGPAQQAAPGATSPISRRAYVDMVRATAAGGLTQPQIEALVAATGTFIAQGKGGIPRGDARRLAAALTNGEFVPETAMATWGDKRVRAGYRVTVSLPLEEGGAPQTLKGIVLDAGVATGENARPPIVGVALPGQKFAIAAVGIEAFTSGYTQLRAPAAKQQQQAQKVVRPEVSQGALNAVQLVGSDVAKGYRNKIFKTRGARDAAKKAFLEAQGAKLIERPGGLQNRPYQLTELGMQLFRANFAQPAAREQRTKKTPSSIQNVPDSAGGPPLTSQGIFD